MRSGALVLALVGLAVLGGCRTATVMRGGVAVPVPQAVDTDLREARAELNAGEPDRARRRLERLLEEFPDGPRDDESLLLLGDSYVELGQAEQAVATYRRLLGRRPRGPWAPLAHLRLAELYRGTRRPELARRVLARAPFDRAEPSVRVRLYTMLAQLAEEAGQDRDALRWLAYARADVAEGAEIARIDRKIEELLERVLSDLELERLSREVPHGPVYDRLLIELATRSLDRGDITGAERWVARLPEDLRPREQEQRELLLERLRTDVVGPGAPVGVALPLSGPYAPYGWSALRGIVLGFGTYTRSPSGLRIHLRDTEGSTEGASRAVQALVSEGVVAVLGPLRSATSAAVADVAEQSRVPLLTLAQEQDLSAAGSWVFRLGVTRADQARVLAQYAVERRGARRLAILYPEDEYGSAYKNQFWEEVEERGAEIVGVESYAPDAVDVQGPIRKLVGLEYLTAKERTLIEERDRLARRPQENAERLEDPELANLPPYVDFDALFIPEAAQKVGLILPQLRFYDVRNVLLLGVSGWNDRKLVEIAGRDAEGVVFTDSFFPRSESPLVQEFVSAYYAAYGEEPDALAAEGYDSALMLREILSEEAVSSRTRVRDTLLEVRDFRGVSGLTSFDEFGGTRKSLYLLTVRRGEISELEQAR